MNVNNVKAALATAEALFRQLTQINSEMAREKELKPTTIGLHISAINAIMNLTKVQACLRQIEIQCGKKPTGEQ